MPRNCVSVRMKSPATAKTTKDKAICVMIRLPPKRPVPDENFLELLCRATLGFSRVERHAGAKPNETPVPMAIIAVNKSTRTSGDRFNCAGALKNWVRMKLAKVLLHQ